MAKRQARAVSAEEKAGVVDVLRSAAPKGFTVEQFEDTGKPHRVCARITGPKTAGHKSGQVEWVWDLGFYAVPDDLAEGFKRSCKAWAAEPALEEG